MCTQKGFFGTQEMVMCIYHQEIIEFLVHKQLFMDGGASNFSSSHEEPFKKKKKKIPSFLYLQDEYVGSEMKPISFFPEKKSRRRYGLFLTPVQNSSLEPHFYGRGPVLSSAERLKKERLLLYRIS